MPLMSQAEYARHRGVSKKTVTVWKQEGRLCWVSDKIDSDASDKRLADSGRFLQPDTVTMDDDGVTQTVTQVTPKVTGQVTDADDGDGEDDSIKLSGLSGMMQSLNLLPTHEAEQLKENYLGLLRKLEYETKAGNLVDASETFAFMDGLWREERDAWLESWTAQTAPKLAAKFGADIAEMQIELERHVRDFLKQRSTAPRRPRR